MNSNTIFRAGSDVTAREVGGEFILLHLGSGTYFGLNAVGSRVWQLLEAGDKSLAQLCNTICDEFDAGPDVVQADLQDLAAALLEHDLVEQMPG